MKDLQAN